jgi:hypothetical protein
MQGEYTISPMCCQEEMAGGIANPINADDKYSPDVVKMPVFHLQGLAIFYFVL